MTHLDIDNPACGGLEALLEDFPLGIVVGDLQARVLECNPEACRILGVTPEELAARGWRGPEWRFFRSDGSLLPPEERPGTPAIAERHTVRMAEMGLMRPDGHFAWLSVTVSFLGEDRLMFSFTDLSEQHAGRELEARQMERVLRETEKRYATMFQMVPVSLVITELVSGRIVATNHAFCQVTGWSEQELLGRTSAEIGLWTQGQERLRGVGLLLRVGAVRGVEVCCRRKDGAPQWLSLSVDVVEIEGTRCLVAAGVDITERRRAEEERQALEARMLRAERMQSLGNLAGGVAHDMNNVLAATLGLACASLQEDPVEPVRECLDTIVRASMVGKATVRRLLDFSRQEFNQEAPLDLNVLVADVLNILERATLQRVRIETDLAPDLPCVLGDAGALPHVLMNVCVNAIDALPTGGSLLVRTRHGVDDQVIVEVCDSGCGMSPEVLHRGLDPYFATGSEVQSALGPPQVHGTVHAQPVHVEIDSVPGQATCVTIRLPSCPEHPSAAEVAPPADGKAARSMRVLLVDDDEILLFALRLQLGHLGHTATAVSRGEDALARLKEGLDVDLVVLDLNMPGLGGARTLQALRAVRPSLPVLVISGRVDETTTALVEAHRPAAAMGKPFTLEELKACLGALDDW